MVRPSFVATRTATLRERSVHLLRSCCRCHRRRRHDGRQRTGRVGSFSALARPARFLCCAEAAALSGHSPLRSASCWCPVADERNSNQSVGVLVRERPRTRSCSCAVRSRPNNVFVQRERRGAVLSRSGSGNLRRGDPSGVAGRYCTTEGPKPCHPGSGGDTENSSLSQAASIGGRRTRPCSQRNNKQGGFFDQFCPSLNGPDRVGDLGM
jgi:hypothetical protein